MTWSAATIGTSGPSATDGSSTATATGTGAASGNGSATRSTGGAMPDAATGSVTLAVSSASALASRCWRRVQSTMASPPRISTARKANRARLFGPGTSGALGHLGRLQQLRGVERRRLLGGDVGDHRLVLRLELRPARGRRWRWRRAAGAARRARCAARSGCRCAGPPGRPCPGRWWRWRRPPPPGPSRRRALPVTVTVTVPEPAVVDPITRSRMSCSVVPWSATAAPLVSTASLPTRRW